MLRINEIIDAVKAYHPTADVTTIMKAYVYSAKVHAGQIRKSGEPYLSHPLAVAGLLADMRLDVASICAALLHDAVEDTPATKEDITGLLGEEVANLVDGVTKISQLEAPTRTARQVESLRKMILAMAADIRVLLIKLADRLHNMRTLGHLGGEKQRRIATETRDIYAPMAHRLGIRRWQAELEDLCLYYLEPEIYQTIKDGVASHKGAQQAFIDKVKNLLREMMAAHGIQCQVSGRAKHYWSIYQKMLRRGVDVEGLYDIIAFRVLVDDLKDCYEALGVVHNTWKPIPGRFRDYIGMPKPNMYQSLHTSVVGPDGQRMEIQIRTHDMHRIAEEGIAAHWQYKESGGGDEAEQKRYSWLRRLMEWQRDMHDPTEFMQSLRMDLYPEEIFVFTPGGEVKELPRGATPIDFAYAIHTEVGNTCVGAKINGRMVSLKTELNTGDQVEILTNPNSHPSKDWLKLVVTSRARSKIKALVRAEEQARSLSLGRDLLDKQLRKHGVTVQQVIKDGRLDQAATELSYKDHEQMLGALAYGKVSAKMLTNRLVPKAGEVEKPRQSLISRGLERLRRKTNTGGIKVRGLDDLLVRFGKCCNPLPGDPIAGFITRGRGVTVHHVDCPNLTTVEPDRMVDVEWDTDAGHPFPVRVQVISGDRFGVLADLSAELKKLAVNILEADVKVSEDSVGTANLTIQVKDAQQLESVLKSLRRVKGVRQVNRLRNP